MSSRAAAPLHAWGRRAWLLMMAGWTATIVLIVLNSLGVLDSHHGALNVVRIASTVIWVLAGACVLFAVRRGRP